MQTFYFIYKTTNLVNGKIYLGKHKTKNLNDGYIGSGKLLKRAINKYGIENFKFEILKYYQTEEELNAAEKELITEEFCLQKDNYNLCVGGGGGFSYVNREGGSYKSRKFSETSLELLSKRRKEWWDNASDERLKLRSERSSKSLKGRIGSFKGKQHTEETRIKMRKTKNSGAQNSQYGSMWITNGTINKKIKTVDIIPEGWYKGRVFS